MRGADTFTESLFTMRRLEDFVPADHPLRPIRAMVNQALRKMDGLFAGMHEADIKGGAGDEGDDGNDDNTGATSFKGQTRSNDTHESSTDADARLYRKGKTASELRYMGHTLSDNRHGLIANAMVSSADGHAEREAAKVMIHAACEAADDETIGITLGADKGYDAKEFIDACRDMGVIPHVAQNKSGRCSAVPDVIAASEGYALSQRKRKLIEQGFGWAKTVGRIRQVMVRGLKRVDHLFVLTMTAYNLTRMRSLGQVRPQSV